MIPVLAALVPRELPASGVINGYFSDCATEIGVETRKTQKGGVTLNIKNQAFLGSGMLIAGLFLPVVTLPFVGTINLFNNGTNWLALGLLALAIVSAVLAVKNRTGDLFLTGVGASGALIYKFVSIQYSIVKMRATLSETIKDNPFASIAQTALGSVQLQWGWLVLAAGAGLLVYAGYKARREIEAPLMTMPDNVARGVAAISLAVLLIGPVTDLFHSSSEGVSNTSATNITESMLPGAGPEAASTNDGGKLQKEKNEYIAQNLTLYDLEARYRQSLLDGRVPGVTFKIKNKGNRTLNEVKVRVVFQDAAGKNIAEEEYYPVLVSESGFGSDNKPLRPNYVWSGKSDEFYTAKSLPSEWKSGAATASIVDIEFGPDE